MFHLKPKPRPPWSVGRETTGKAVARAVHPAHVPLEAKAEAALVSRPRNAGEGSRFFGDGDRPWKAAVDQLVGAAQEGDRFAVFLASIGVGQPFALFAGIVEVKHRGDSVDAQPVDVEAIDPVKCVAIEKVGDLGATKIVDRRVPVWLEALARVGMFVERGAVEMRQPLLVGRKMRRDPVEDDGEARGVRSIDEARKGGRIAEGPRRRK